MKVLLIDDDVLLCQGIARQLKKEKINCDYAHKGSEGLKMAKSGSYDLLILDVILPDCTGHDVLKRCRMNDVKTPVLMLSNEDTQEHKIKGFDYGADDYLTKPFNVKELIARVYAIIRRNKGYSEPKLKVGVLELDVKEKIATVSNVKLDLTNKEYSVLELLVLNQGTTLNKEVFFQRIYSDNLDAPDAKIIDVFICKLRRKISEACGHNPNYNYIHTEWGRGYSLKVDCDNRSNESCAV